MNKALLQKLFLFSVAVYISKHPVLCEDLTSSCESHNASANLLSLGQAANCLPRLSDPTHASEYDVCKIRPCFLFIRSSPVISFDTSVLNKSATHLQTPFACNDPGRLHPSLRGIAFEILKRVTKDSLCIWAGPAASCTFNALVDYTAVMAEQGYKFAITGLLLDMPTRRCNHIPSAPIWDNPIVIVGRREDASNDPLHQLVRPFRLGSWLIILGMVLLFLVVSFIAVMRMKTITNRRSFLTALYMMFTGDADLSLCDGGTTHRRSYRQRIISRLRSNRAAIRTRSTRRLICGARTKSAGYRCSKHSQVQEDEGMVNTRFAKYNLSMTLFRISLASFFAVFALFYEVAIVNFLFQQGSVQLGKSLHMLSHEELSRYAVLNNSALEVVWNNTVNKNGIKYNLGKETSKIPWKRCTSGRECIEWVADESNEVRFAVTYETKGRYLIHQVSSCEKLTIIETTDALYHFSSGWLYTRTIERDFVERIDRKIVSLRMRGELSRIFEYETGDTSCNPVTNPDIGAPIILIPFGVLVLPFLFGSLFVLCFWGRKQKDEDHTADSNQVEKQSSSASLQSSLSDVTLSPKQSSDSFV